MSEELKLAAPWVTAYHELEALFGQDPEVRVEYNDEAKEAALYVESADKAEAIARILPGKLSFGNVTLEITVKPANKEASDADLVERAFKGNGAFAGMVTAGKGAPGTFSYAMFKREVVQFYNDELCDPDGMKSTLMADIANRYIERRNGVYFSTARE